MRQVTHATDAQVASFVPAVREGAGTHCTACDRFKMPGSLTVLVKRVLSVEVTQPFSGFTHHWTGAITAVRLQTIVALLDGCPLPPRCGMSQS